MSYRDYNNPPQLMLTVQPINVEDDVEKKSGPYAYLKLQATCGLLTQLINHVKTKTNESPDCVYYDEAGGRYWVRCNSINQFEKLVDAPYVGTSNNVYYWHTEDNRQILRLLVIPTKHTSEPFLADALSKVGKMEVPMRNYTYDKVCLLAKLCILSMGDLEAAPKFLTRADGTRIADVYDCHYSTICYECGQVKTGTCRCGISNTY